MDCVECNKPILDDEQFVVPKGDRGLLIAPAHIACTAGKYQYDGLVAYNMNAIRRTVLENHQKEAAK